jgi:hypothetical protein
MNAVMHCWPTAWIDAAVKAGLAVEAEDHVEFIGGDRMRDQLAIFACSLSEIVHDEVIH